MMRKIAAFFKKIIFSKYAVVTIVAAIIAILLLKDPMAALGLLLVENFPFLIIYASISTTYKRGGFVISFVILGIIAAFAALLAIRNFVELPIGNWALARTEDIGRVLLWVYAVVLSCFVGFDGIKRFRNRTNYATAKSKETRTSTNDVAIDYSNPTIVMAEGICQALDSKCLSKYLLTDFSTDTTITYGDFGSKEKTSEKLNLLFIEILKHLNLPPFIKLTIEYVKTDTVDAAGEYKRKGDDKTIVLWIKPDYGPNHIVATLCHECTHYFMEYNSLNWNDTYMNEVRTDVMTNLIGFNRILIDGYKKIIVDVQTNGNVQTTKTHKIGYIAAEDCMSLRAFLLKQRAKIRSQEAQRLKQKQHTNDMKNLLETATVLCQQLNVLDPRGTSNSDIRTKSQIDALSQALYEYEARDIEKEINKYYSTLNSNPSIEMIEKTELSVKQLCDDMLRWSAAFQGKNL